MVKLKSCKVCKAEFQPFSTLHVACGPVCAIEYAKQSQKKRYDRKTREMRREFRHKDISYWKQRAARSFHRFVRARDGDTCISCGDRSGRQTHAGHFRTRSAASQLAYHWANCNSQCARCNLFLSGNLAAYRQALERKTSPEMVEYLENENSTYKWTIDDLKDVVWWYDLQYKDLK